MDRKRRRMIEGELYLFSLPRAADKPTILEAVETALEATGCGRILGSGISIADGGTIVIEVGAYDRDAAGDAISHVCRELKCRDFELVWD